MYICVPEGTIYGQGIVIYTSDKHFLLPLFIENQQERDQLVAKIRNRVPKGNLVDPFLNFHHNKY